MNFIRRYRLYLIIGLITLLFFLLNSNNFFNLLPNASVDDGLQFNLAHTLSKGKWLGRYGDLTLAKGISYPVYLSMLHKLNLPLWVGGTVLYSVACLAFIFAVRRLISKRIVLVGIYCLILFNPMISIRIYRDSIAPALGLLTLAWIIGTFLVTVQTYKSKLNNRLLLEYLLLTTIGVVAVPIWWYLREDYFWILPFVLTGAALTIAFSLYSRFKIKTNSSNWRPLVVVLAIILPFLMVLAVGSAISYKNKHNYGRYVVNDYTSADFRSAYGALTRIKDDHPNIVVPVSQSMRERAYEASPLFRSLKPCLDNQNQGNCEVYKHNKRVPGEYEGGWFFWALRMAAKEQGYYRDAATSENFYRHLAKEINQACDNHSLECSRGARSSLAPPFSTQQITPTLNSTRLAIGYMVWRKTRPQLDPQALVIPKFASQQAEMAKYLDVRYKPEQLNSSGKIKIRAQYLIGVVYTLLNPILVVISILLLLIQTYRRWRHRSVWPALLIFWGLLLLLMVRVLMIGYVNATSFWAINSLYLSSAFPIMFALEGLIIGWTVCNGVNLKKLNPKNDSSKSKSRAKNRS